MASPLSPESRARMDALLTEYDGRFTRLGIEIGFVAAHVEAEQQQRELEDALSFYANVDHWHGRTGVIGKLASPVDIDRGAKARAVLAVSSTENGGGE